jgi:putative transcriptional regulator
VESTRGQLLIAGPSLTDPNFWRTVVLVVEHTGEGALGLILNRPSDSTAEDAVPELLEMLDPDGPLFVGGPVQPSGVVVLAEFEDPGDAALLSFDDIGVVLSAAAPEQLAAGVREARAFAGHSGWGPGQLESEIEEGAWILEPARRDDAFCAEPEELWSSVLERKGGRYQLVARMPVDPSLN